MNFQSAALGYIIYYQLNELENGKEIILKVHPALPLPLPLRHRRCPIVVVGVISVSFSTPVLASFVMSSTLRNQSPKDVFTEHNIPSRDRRA